MEERQPLKVKGLPFRIVLDGRLDNRPDLLDQLNIPPAEGKRLSDAALILRAYDRWGETCFEHFIGDYALVIFDEAREHLLCARDSLGERTLFYSIRGPRVVIASEPWAVAGADLSAAELDENAVAYHFALRAMENGQTLFKNIFELLPAHAMVIHAKGERVWRYWKPDPSIRLRGKTDREYAEQFLLLLEESIRCRLRSTTPAGVLLSGGLDSGSIACLAARLTAPSPLTTISYVFDELTNCDERQYIHLIEDRWGIRSIQIPCDDAWPYKDWEHWPHNPNHPEENSYRLLKERAYRRAHAEGLRVLLPGAFGDELYCGEDDWFADLLAEGRLRDAARELKRHLHYLGPRGTLETVHPRRVIRRLWHPLSAAAPTSPPRKAPAWLTDDSAARLNGKENWLDPAFERKADLLGVGASQDSSREYVNASRHAVELRHPYRDRRLAEYVISLPAHQLYNLGFYKYILRVAMQGILPEPILSRSRPSSLLSLYVRGMEREREWLQAGFRDPHAAWRKHVRADWVLKHWDAPLTFQTPGTFSVVPWLCISYQSWLHPTKE